HPVPSAGKGNRVNRLTRSEKTNEFPAHRSSVRKGVDCWRVSCRDEFMARACGVVQSTSRFPRATLTLKLARAPALAPLSACAPKRIGQTASHPHRLCDFHFRQKLISWLTPANPALAGTM